MLHVVNSFARYQSLYRPFLWCLTLTVFFSVIPVGCLGDDSLLHLDVEDLSQVRVEEAYATLSTTDPREAPASVTVITASDMLNSGARSLDELLDIYVPGFQYMYKPHGNQAGIRGIISDRNNKLLLLVNGRPMNIKASDGGAVTERWFSMLTDIRRVTVVNGPGSAVYGPGAIAGIINIETWSGKSFQGLDVSARGGAVENFGSIELKYGTQLANKTGFFLYYGLDGYSGANNDNAPLKFSIDINNPRTGISYKKDTKPDFPVPNDNKSFRGLMRHKLHLQIDGENYEFWARYTLSGQRIPGYQGYYFKHPEYVLNNGAGNQQLTVFGVYSQYLNSWLSLEYMLSYMLSDVQINFGPPDYMHLPGQGMADKHWSEDETMGRVMAHIIPWEGHKLALSVEYYYNNFGRRGYLYSKGPSNIFGLPLGTKWNSHMVSLVGEYMMRPVDDVLMVFGLRADKHRFTHWMFSPRAAIIYELNPSNVLKFIYNHSVRHADDADLYHSYLNGEKSGEIESIDNFEVDYDSDPWSWFHLVISTFYNRHRVVAFDQAVFGIFRVGLVQTYGIEASLSIKTSCLRLCLAHSFTKLLDFDLDSDDLLMQNISAYPYGYGHDLANWINNATKFILDYKFTDRLSFHGSARIYWGIPGGKDMARYNSENTKNPALPFYGSNKAYGKSFFLDAGLEYRHNEHLDITLHGYNLLGVFDKDLNKRNFFQTTSQYRDAAPAVALRVSLSF